MPPFLRRLDHRIFGDNRDALALRNGLSPEKKPLVLPLLVKNALSSPSPAWKFSASKTSCVGFMLILKISVLKIYHAYHPTPCFLAQGARACSDGH